MHLFPSLYLFLRSFAAGGASASCLSYVKVHDWLISHQRFSCLDEHLSDRHVALGDEHVLLVEK